MNRGSYCLTKCCILFSKLWLLVAFIFYVLFAALAAALTFAPPEIQEIISEARGVCVTVPAMGAQLIQDNHAAIDQLRAAGQDVSEFDSTLAELDLLVRSVKSGCDFMEAFFMEIFDIFLPAMLCVLTICYALFVNQTLCCVAGCCSGPPTQAAPPAGKAPPTMTGVGEMTEMQQVAVQVKKENELAQP